MDEDRLVISDELWAKIAPLLLGKAGDPGATLVGITVGSWRPYFGVCEQGLPGVTCPRISATGIRFSNDFVDGQRPVCLRDFSTP